MMRIVPVALVFGISIATAAAPARVDVTGSYTSNWDDVHLVQQGDRVRGTYVCCGGGTIEGRVIEGRIIRYRWIQPDAQGSGVWTITEGGLVGTWGFGQSERDGGDWTLTPRAQLAN